MTYKFNLTVILCMCAHTQWVVLGLNLVKHSQRSPVPEIPGEATLEAPFRAF